MPALLIVALVLTAAQAVPWITHASTAGRYSVELPAAPQETSDTLTVEGREFVQHSAQVGSPSAVYLVMWGDPPIPDTAVEKEAYVESARKGFIDSVKGRQLTAVPNNSGQAGQEFTVSMPSARGDVFVRIRIFFTARRAYMLMMMSPGSGSRPEDERRFFGSFKVIQ